MQVGRINEVHGVPHPTPFVFKSSSIFTRTVNAMVLVDLTRNYFNQFHISVYRAYLLLPFAYFTAGGGKNWLWLSNYKWTSNLSSVVRNHRTVLLRCYCKTLNSLNYICLMLLHICKGRMGHYLTDHSYDFLFNE